MFFKKENRNKKNIIYKIENYKMKPSSIEKNIIIPNIISQMNAISFLFKEMGKIFNQLKNENSEFSQDFIKDLEAMMIDYYKQKSPMNDLNVKQIEEEGRNGAKEIRELLLGAISSHFNQYIDHLNNLGQISPKEDKIETITEYMVKVKAFMFNIIQMKEKIFSVIMPMTVMIKKDSKTKKEIGRLPMDHPIKKIGLLPFETRINEMALLGENGIKTIDSWLDHLKSRKIRYLEAVVNQSKVQVAQEQAKTAKWTFYTQIGFMILSVLFIVASCCLSEYKEEWIDFFVNKQNVDKTLVEKECLTNRIFH